MFIDNFKQYVNENVTDYTTFGPKLE